MFPFNLHGFSPGSEGQNRWSQEGLREVSEDPHQAWVRVLSFLNKSEPACLYVPGPTATMGSWSTGL